MKTVSKSRIESALAELKTTLERIHGELASLRSASTGVANQPTSIAENVALLMVAIDRLAADGFKDWKNFLATPSPDQKTASRLFEPIFGTLREDLNHIFGNLCPIFADEFKKKLPMFLASIAPENQISEADRQKQITELARKIETLEREEETIYLELEGIGAVVDRPADMSPAVFLGSSNGGGYDPEKLHRLERYIRAMARDDTEMANAVNGGNAKIVALKAQMADAECRRQVTRPETYKASIDRINAALRKEEESLSGIKERRIPLDARRSAAITLMNASKNFLREQGVNFEA